MERNKTSHAEQISDYVNVEAHAQLHDDLVAMRRRLDLYFAPHIEGCDCSGIPGIRDPRCWPENNDFEPSRYYGEGKNE
jgi:hypothetical protein